VTLLVVMLLGVTLLGRAGSSFFHIRLSPSAATGRSRYRGGVYVDSNRGATGPHAPTGGNLKGEPGRAVSESVRLADSRDREC